MPTASYAISLAVVLTTAVAGSIFTSKSVKSEWYACIKPRRLTPPAYVFPIVWTALYLTLFLALARAIDARDWTLASMICAGLVLNVVWCYLYFSARRVEDALVCIAIIALLAVASVAWCARKKETHLSWLLVPYAAWVCFASLLNAFSVQKITLCSSLYF